VSAIFDPYQVTLAYLLRKHVSMDAWLSTFTQSISHLAFKEKIYWPFSSRQDTSNNQHTSAHSMLSFPPLQKTIIKAFFILSLAGDLLIITSTTHGWHTNPCGRKG
jgi:hypothetical protein